MKLTTTLTALLLLGATAPAFSQVVFQEDFEGVTTPALPANWDNKTAGAGGWITNSGQVNLVNTSWYIPAHTKFAVINDYGNQNDINNPSRLTTPNIDISTLTAPALRFQYYFSGAVLTSSGIGETFNVEASIDTGKTWKVLKTVTASGAAKWGSDSVALGEYLNEDALMIAFTFDDKAQRLVGAAVDDIEVYEYGKQHDAKLQAISPDPSLGVLVSAGVSGSTLTLGGTIYNNGALPITAIDVHYQVGANPVVTTNLTGINIQGFSSDDFTFSTPYTLPSQLGEYDCKVWLDLVSDADATNDSGDTKLYSVSFKPNKKILAEEATGTWCGWCPRGLVYLDSVANSPTHKNSFSLVAVHNKDPMTVAAYDSKISVLVGNSYPGMMVDRHIDVDPSAIFAAYDEMKDYFGYADITLTDVAAAGFNYSVKVSVKPAIDLTGDYRLALALTEDDVRGTGAGWAQANYYSGYSQLSGSGLNWFTESNPVPAEKMHYNHVARGIFPNPNGAAGSLPATMTAGTSYDYTFNVPMQPWWNRSDNLMHAVVMLIRNSDGHVLNSNNIVVPLGIENKDAGISAFTVFPNPASDKAVVNFSLADASDVDVVVTDMMGRTVQVVNKSAFTAGKHQMNINLSGVAAGVYNVTLNTDNGMVSTRLSVVK